MPAEQLTDEQLKGHAIQQALAGDTVGSQKTASRIVNRSVQREVWQMILFAAANRKAVSEVKDIIAACPDSALLRCHSYRELPLDFVRAGDISGGIEIAKAMGDHGILPLMLIPILLSMNGDMVRAQEALSNIQDEVNRTAIMNMIAEIRPESKPT